MELTKETIRTIPLAKLQQLYTVLSEEIPGIVLDSYLCFLEHLAAVMGENTDVKVFPLTRTLVAETRTLVGSLEDLAKNISVAHELDGFSINYSASRDGSEKTYSVCISHLPIELDCLFGEPGVTLKTVIRKLRK